MVKEGNAMVKKYISTIMPIYAGTVFRVCPIQRLIPSRFFENGMPQFDEDTIETLPISEGLAIEGKCCKGEDGHDCYYVVSFAYCEDGKIRYEAYLDRVADVLCGHSTANEEFREALKAAETALFTANKVNNGFSE